MKLSDYVMQKMNLDEAQKALLIPRIHELEASEKAAVQRMNDAEDAMVRMMDELQQAQEEITTWEAKAALFVDQGDEIERLRIYAQAWLTGDFVKADEMENEIKQLVSPKGNNW